MSAAPQPGAGVTAAPLKAVSFMVAAAGVLTVNDAIAKWLTQSYPVGEVIAVRGLLVLALTWGWAVATGGSAALRVRSWRLQTLRGALMALSTFLFITGLALLPIADAIAISFAGPLLATALAALLLGERVGWRRWSAVGAGFVGVLLMVRPTPELVRVVAFVPLLAALFGALRDVVTRRLGAGGESTLAILMVSTVMVSVAGLCTLPWGWAPLGPSAIALFVASAVMVGAAQALMIESFRLGEVGLVGPFKYTSLVWAVLLGLLVWGDLPSPWTWTGAGLVVGSGIYIWHRETRLVAARRRP